jgi:hypothetical protein
MLFEASVSQNSEPLPYPIVLPSLESDYTHLCNAQNMAFPKPIINSGYFSVLNSLYLDKVIVSGAFIQRCS